MTHPSVIRPSDHAVYTPAKMGKTTIFASDRLLVGLNAFEPGQSHDLHAHSGMDKVYSVVEGEGLFLLGGLVLRQEARRPGLHAARQHHLIRRAGEHQDLDATLDERADQRDARAHRTIEHEIEQRDIGAKVVDGGEHALRRRHAHHGNQAPGVSEFSSEGLGQERVVVDDQNARLNVLADHSYRPSRRNC